MLLDSQPFTCLQSAYAHYLKYPTVLSSEVFYQQVSFITRHLKVH